MSGFVVQGHKWLNSKSVPHVAPYSINKTPRADWFMKCESA